MQNQVATTKLQALTSHRTTTPQVYDLSAPQQQQQQALSQAYQGLDRLQGQSQYEEHPWERGTLTPTHTVK